jgi:CheY-like chemotaxis protein
VRCVSSLSALPGARASNQRGAPVRSRACLISLLSLRVSSSILRRRQEVQGEQDPHAALARFRRNPAAFNVVITDLSMPGMGGFELARELLAIRPGLLIIITSGFVQPEDQESARTIGMRESY